MEPSKNFKFKFSLIDGTLDKEFREHFPSFQNGLYASQPGGFVVNPEFALNAEKIYNIKPRSNDIWVVTFPKSGTTWVQDLIWLVVNDCDYEGAKTSLHIRSPFLELEYFTSESIAETYEKNTITRLTGMPMMAKLWGVLCHFKVASLLRPAVRKIMYHIVGHITRNLKEIEAMKEQRILKTHVPLCMLNPEVLNKSKVVYVIRNPKDVIVSYYHYHKLMDYQQYTGSVEDFAEYFMDNKILNGPYFPHLFDAWSRRHHPNILFVFYEDLKKDLRAEIVRIAAFLGKTLTDEEITKLKEHLGFDSFAKNEAVNYEFFKEYGIVKPKGHFIRKGITGDWKNHFSPEQNSRLDQWIAKNIAGTDLSFVTELPEQN